MQELQQEIEDEISFVFSIGANIWGILGSALGSTGVHLRSLCCEVALVSFAYFGKKLEILSEPPWSFFLLPARAALLAIRQMHQPEDPVLFKIWTLARLNYDESVLLEGLELVKRLGWSTNSTEQGHSASSATLRFHRASGVTMQVRSVLHQCRSLFAATPEEKQLERAEAKLRRLQAKNPNKIGQKSAFVGELLDISAGGSFAATHALAQRGQA
eukprot:15438049-Alexandrium_andersonii.AAC.1